MKLLPEGWKRSGFYNGADEDYNPDLLLNALMDKMHLKEDAELAKRLRMDKRLLGQIRNRRLQISGSMLMQMQEATGITIAELRRILGDRRSKSRMACTLEQRK
jgi:transcriptional regulator with XRE-family HTH domain